MQTIRQAFILLRQNPLLSTIFILGTAFAITMIMAIVITWQMKYADIEPEVNRSRSLYISKMHLQGKENKGWNNYTACSPAFMKYNPQIQISAESETKRSIFREKDKTKRSKKESAQHSKSRNKSFVMTSVSAL